MVACALLVTGCQCHPAALTGQVPSLRLPAAVECGQVRVGAHAQATLSVENPTPVTASPAAWSVEGPFALQRTPTNLPTGTTTLEVVCAPTALGVVSGTVTVVVGSGRWTSELTMEGVAPPPCPDAGPCAVSTWSEASGRCETGLLAEGTACPSVNRCLKNPRCHAGQCEAPSLDCDDGDPCTVDVCAPDVGCQHLPRACPGDGRCQVGRCDPTLGCVLEAAVDGAPCGALRGCDAAQICVSGTCQVRTPPEGFTCAEASPCQPAGRCVESRCEQAPPQPLQPTWSAPVDGGIEAWADLFTTTRGTLVASSYFLTPPTFGVDQTAPVVAPAGSARRCIAWGERVVCADYPGNVIAGVSAIDPVSGEALWTYQGVTAQLPSFAGPSMQVFLGRLAVVSEQSLLALFEARPLATDGTATRCRRFGMVLLDGAGRPMASALVEHQIFEACTHPHSYGVAVDAAGAIYLAFTPSDADNPASALDGTVLLSYSRALTLRWAAEVPGLVGGELAVAGGLLLHERSSTVWRPTSGEVMGALPSPFGSGVVSDELVLLADETSVWALERGSLVSRWRQALADPVRGPLLLASLPTSFGDRSAVLGFSQGAGWQLFGLDVATGVALFRCPLALEGRPVMASLSSGRLAVLWGPTPVDQGGPACERCDPHWARTRNTVSTFTLPRVTPGAAPWAGPWGGPGHQHREAGP